MFSVTTDILYDILVLCYTPSNRCAAGSPCDCTVRVSVVVSGVWLQVWQCGVARVSGYRCGTCIVVLWCLSAGVGCVWYGSSVRLQVWGHV